MVSVLFLTTRHNIFCFEKACFLNLQYVTVASIFYEKGVFEAILELKNLPYLAHEENKRRYDGIEVGDILTDIPVESVGPMETAQRLVELLETSAHHGFPVIDSETKRFLGLVRRDQIAALLECGVFDRTLRNNVVSSAWARPQAGVEKTPLMSKLD